MKTPSVRRRLLFLLFATLHSLLCLTAALGQSTAFTYQGRLNNGAATANGVYDLTFALYDAGSGGNLLAGPVTNVVVGVSNGLFTATIDLGANFPGADRFLQIGVRSNASGAFTALAPRQQLTAVPYAVSAAYLSSVLTRNTMNTTNGATVAGGSYNSANANYSTVGGGNDNNAAGDYAVVAGGYFNHANVTLAAIGGGLNNWIVGSGDWVSVPPVLYPESTFATIAGGWGNYITNGFAGSVSGGLSNVLAWSDYSAIGGGAGNMVLGATVHPIPHPSPYAVIGGGLTNLVGPDVYAATIAGGAGNVVQGLTGVSSSYGVIGGGLTNTIGTSARAATIGGGEGNRVGLTADYATVAGGQRNQAGHLGAVGGGYINLASGAASVVAGGGQNLASGNSAAVGGGFLNQATGDWSVVGAGFANFAAGRYSCVPGGAESGANGDFSFAAGRHAQANHTGTFVWADSTDTLFASAASNTFVIRASGGVGINKPNPTTALDVYGVVTANGISSLGNITAIQVSASDKVEAGRITAVGNISGNQLLANSVTASQSVTAAQLFASSNVGIGVNAPAYPLDVAGRLRSRDGGGYTAGMWLQTAHSSGPGGVADIGFFGVLDATRIGFYGNDPRGGSAWGLTFDTFSGNVGIGTGTGYPTYKLQVNGSVGGVGNYNNISDRRYKKNISTLDHALDKVMQLRGVSYDWRQDEYPQLNFDTGPQIGFIAQEIREVLPEVVSTDAAGVQSVAYSKVVPVLVEAIKEQQHDLSALSNSALASNETTSSTVKALRGRLEHAEAEIAELKQTVNELQTIIRASATVR